MPASANADFPTLLESAVKFAKAAGADAADAVIGRNLSLSVGERLGKLEKLQRSEAQDLGLRVFIGKQQAIVSTSDFAPRRARKSWRSAPSPWRRWCRRIPFAASPIPARSTSTRPSSRSSIPKSRARRELIALVRAAEDAARSVEGRHQFRRRRSRLGPQPRWPSLASNGFYGGYASRAIRA